MSYENLPKNLTEKAVLVRGGRPDYTKLKADAFPVPTADEMGAILEVTDTGDRYRWSSTTWNKIQSAAMSFTSDMLLEIRRGNIAGHTIVNPIGSNPAVGTALAPLTTSGTYQMPTVATALEILSSDNVNDVAAGGGARSVLITGLSNTNGVWTEENQIVALNGTTPVAVPNSMLRVHGFIVISSGTYADAVTPSHNSTITLRVASAGATWATIIPEGAYGMSGSEIGAYSIPKGKTGYLIHGTVKVEGTKAISFLFGVRQQADVIIAPFDPMLIVVAYSGISDELTDIFKAPTMPIVGPADTIVFTKTAAGNSAATIRYELLLIDD